MDVGGIEDGAQPTPSVSVVGDTDPDVIEIPAAVVPDRVRAAVEPEAHVVPSVLREAGLLAIPSSVCDCVGCSCTSTLYWTKVVRAGRDGSVATDSGVGVEAAAGVPIVPTATVDLDEDASAIPVGLEARPVIEDHGGTRIGGEAVRRRVQIGIEIAAVWPS